MEESRKWYPFHSALIFGDLTAAKDLFDRGNHRELLTRSTPGKGWRAIHFACHSGSNEAVSWLLGLDACDPSARTAKGETALHLSAIRGDERVCETLINGGCSAEAVTLEGKTALHLAAEMGHLPVTRFLVVGAGLSPATPDGGGASAAALALAGNHKSVVRLLQKNCPGVPMGVPKRTNSRRASDFGALISSPDFQKGWDYGAKGMKGRERRSGRVSLGGDGGGRGKGGGGGNRGGLKGADEAGRRLLEAARVGDTMAMGRVLARGEIDVEWVGRSNGWTALMEAAEHGSLEAVCYLLDTGADLEHTNKKGLTPLQLAVRAGHLGVTEELLTRGARPNVKSKAGLCLRCLASSMGHDYLVDWLFAMGVADGEDGGCACSGATRAGGSGGGSGGGGGGGGGDAVSNDLATREISGGATSNNGNGAPPGQALTSAASVALTEWLGNLGLSAYESRLVSQGFDTLEAMGTATESDLESIGFKKGHLRLLLARAPFAVASFGGSSVNVAAAVEQVGLTRTESTLSTTATLGYNVGNEFVEAATRTARFAAPQAETQGDGDEDEEGKDRYCDASALQPCRALSNSASEGDGRSDGSGDGFKELKPEEVDIDDVIGEGSFGVVLRARWRGMDVAVKELKTRIASASAATAAIAAGGDATADIGVSAAVGGGRGGAVMPRDGDGDGLMDSQEEMRQEARMLAKVCNHNCVVQFVGVLFQPTPSVVTMFMENGSVEDMLVSSNSPAKKELVVRMAIEAAKGMIHLHREGVVHNYLASRNLLLDDGFHVRISDFGFNRVKRECASRGYTRSDMGPIKWTSPEAMRKQWYSEASDAFSFGVVLYEMFARSPPWEGHENLDVAFRVCSGERLTVPDRVDAPIAELMSKCWGGNPRRRPEFASILTALTEFACYQRQTGEEAALVAVAPPSRSFGGGSKKSAAATKTAKAKAEASDSAAEISETHFVPDGDGRSMHGSKFSGQARVVWARNFARGLANMHSADIRHNDSASRNALLSRRDPDGQVLLSDFGLSKILADEADHEQDIVRGARNPEQESGTPLKEVTLAQSLGPGPSVYTSVIHAVELELQAGSLAEEVPHPVKVTPSLKFVECRIEGSDRAPFHGGDGLTEEFLAMTFVRGPEEAVFQDDQPAKLRFFVGYSDEFTREHGTEEAVEDSDIERYIFESFRPLTSPDGQHGWTVMDAYSVVFRLSEGQQEVWAETTLEHFSTKAFGIKIKGYDDFKHGDSTYYYGDMGGFLTRRFKGASPTPKVRFGNATQEIATFTSWPIVQHTDVAEEKESSAEIGAEVLASVGGGMRTQSSASGISLAAAQEPVTTIVRSGGYEDTEPPCDIRAHLQMHVKVGVIRKMEAGTNGNNGTGSLQLLDLKRMSGNKILVLRQPRLETPSMYPEIEWPCTGKKICAL
eukprot:g2689.t1